VNEANRILFFLPDVQGGVKTYVSNLVKVLRQQGVNCVMVSYLFENSLTHKSKVSDDRAYHLAVSKYASLDSRYRLLSNFIRKDDVLVCNDSFELEAINALRLPNKIVFVLHGDLNHYKNTLTKYQCFIDLVICVSSGLKAKYEELFPSLKFVVSTPFVFQPKISRGTTKGIVKGVFIGRFEYLKGADLFLELVKQYEGNIEWTVICPVEGNDEVLMNQVPKDVAVFKGISNDRVLSLLTGLDILVFPSRSEGFGIVVLEAMMNGVVPVVLNIPIGIPDQVRNGFNGFIIPEEKWNDAQVIIKELEGDRDKLYKTGMNAIAFAKESFNPVTIAGRFIEQVRRAVARNDKDYCLLKKEIVVQILPEFLYRSLKKIKASFSHSVSL
jgi:glycosyltransferase involved in cell wall biosynthesis